MDILPNPATRAIIFASGARTAQELFEVLTETLREGTAKDKSTAAQILEKILPDFVGYRTKASPAHNITYVFSITTYLDDIAKFAPQVLTDDRLLAMMKHEQVFMHMKVLIKHVPHALTKKTLEAFNKQGDLLRHLPAIAKRLPHLVTEDLLLQMSEDRGFSGCVAAVVKYAPHAVTETVLLQTRSPGYYAKIAKYAPESVTENLLITNIQSGSYIGQYLAKIAKHVPEVVTEKLLLAITNGKEAAVSRYLPEIAKRVPEAITEKLLLEVAADMKGDRLSEHLPAIYLHAPKGITPDVCNAAKISLGSVIAGANALLEYKAHKPKPGAVLQKLAATLQPV